MQPLKPEPLTLFSTFPPEGYSFYVARHVVLPFWLLVGVGVLFFALAAGSLWLLLRKPRWSGWASHFTRPAWLVAFQYLFVCAAFACWYQAAYERNPTHFRFVSDAPEARIYRALEHHQSNLERLDLARRIITITTSGLRSNEQRELLRKFAGSIDGDVVRLYRVVLALAIVRPMRPFDAVAADLQTKAFGGDPGELRRAEEVTAQTRPGLVMELPAWSDLQKVPVVDLLNMTELLTNVVGRQRNGSIQVQAADDERLREYLESSVGLPAAPGDRVDLSAASDAMAREEVSEQTVLYLGTHDVSRFADFAYFSLITIATVGYGDILPNSRWARSLVGWEVLLGIAILVLVVNEFLGNRPSSVAGA